VNASGGVAIHGFALNVSPPLEQFQLIIPCGLKAPVTSLAAHVGPEATPPLALLAERLAPLLADGFGEPLSAISQEELPLRPEESAWR
jgi:lipoate-protein ligase B